MKSVKRKEKSDKGGGENQMINFRRISFIEDSENTGSGVIEFEDTVKKQVEFKKYTSKDLFNADLVNLVLQSLEKAIQEGKVR
jgi:hypothetical protein